MRKYFVLSVASVLFLVLIDSVLAQPQPSMYTLDNIYYYLTEGTEATWGGHSLDPQSGVPGQDINGFTKSLDNIYDDIKIIYTACAVGCDDVREGVSFFSTQTSFWGVQTGTLSVASSDSIFLDIFSEANGCNNSVDIGNTDATYLVDKYSNPEIGINENLTLTQTSSLSYVKTKTIVINGIVFKHSNIVYPANHLTMSYCRVDFKYSDSTTASLYHQNNLNNIREPHDYTNPNLEKTVNNIEVWLKKDNNPYNAVEESDRTYFVSGAKNCTIQLNEEQIPADPRVHQIYCHNSIDGSGNITYDISFDGGTGWVTGQSLNIKNTSVHPGSSMIIKINLNGVGAGNTAEASDYVIMLWY